MRPRSKSILLSKRYFNVTPNGAGLIACYNQHVNSSPSRVAFATLCAFGILVIAYGAALEISRQKRGGGIVSPRQFRVRMVSAAVWMVILAANFYAVTALWPTAEYKSPGVLTAASKAQARLFIQVVGASFSLVFVGLFLFFIDMRHTARERHELELQHVGALAALAQDAAERLKGQKATAAPANQLDA